MDLSRFNFNHEMGDKHCSAWLNQNQFELDFYEVRDDGTAGEMILRETYEELGLFERKVSLKLVLEIKKATKARLHLAADRKSTRLNSSHSSVSRMPSSA